MGVSLRKVLIAEGRYNDIKDIPSEIVDAAQQLGYYFGMIGVITKYKPAAKKRREGGCNYVDDFRAAANDFAYLSRQTTEDQIVVQALLLHNAASSLAVVNGNLPDQQVELNAAALTLLEEVPDGERNDDWWCVYEKVYVGLVEGEHMPFEEDQYRQVLDSMIRNESKDAAGRADFLAHKLEERGHFQEAIGVLEGVEGYTFSPENQRNQAMATLRDFRTRFLAVPTTNRGTTREHRAAAASDGGESSGEGSEVHHLIRRRNWHTRRAVCSFVLGGNPCVTDPPVTHISKTHQLPGAFLFVCFF